MPDCNTEQLSSLDTVQFMDFLQTLILGKNWLSAFIVLTLHFSLLF